MPVVTRTSRMQKAVLPNRKIPMPEWGKGKYVYVFGMTAAQQKRVSKIADSIEGLDEVEIVIAWFIFCACDEKGNPIFKDTDRKKLLNDLFLPMNRCVVAFMDLNGIGDDAAKN